MADSEKPKTSSSAEQQVETKPAPVVDVQDATAPATATVTEKEKALAGSSGRSHSSTDDSDEPAPHLHAKTFLAVLAVCLIYMAQLVNLVGAGAQGQVIAGHFNDTANTVWFSAPITIMTVVLGPIVAQAADYWGRKWFLVILTLFGAVGSVIVARAQSMNMAIGGFCVIGIAFGTQPLLHVVTSEVLPRRWRSWGQAADMCSNAAGSILGLYVGGALNRTSDPASDGFRYYFYMTMACFLIAAIMCAIVYNPPPMPLQNTLTNAEKLARLDWVGYFFLATGLVLFSVGLAYSKNPYEWTDPHVSATFAVGLTLALCLVGYETFVKKDGMFHHGLFKNRNFAVSTFCVFCEASAFFAANTYFAFEVSVLYETDALLVGARYSIMMVSSAITAGLTGWYCARTKRIRWVSTVSFVAFAVFFICMANANTTTNKAAWFYPVLLGVGLGMSLTSLVTAAQLSTPPELISIASGTIISVRSLGGTVGIAIYNALFNDAIGRLGDNVAAAAIADGLAPDNVGPFIGALTSHNQTALGGIPGVTPQMIGDGASTVANTFVVAFRNVWIAAACFVALGGIASAFLFDPQKEFNMHIDAPVEKEEDLYSA
ncbi:major facilitator superfamily domain-containing protein [Podospora appendiculata]|uniref:Major facilitator superfamily domain-containing protein n=1 Tax=Podospora appendiculata TaxID=314037 RepID=A0AAE0XIP6_9PEZI|nr:major facilitator superfamily domain-containing protein [Podospora appendiculata]